MKCNLTPSVKIQWFLNSVTRMPIFQIFQISEQDIQNITFLYYIKTKSCLHEYVKIDRNEKVKTNTGGPHDIREIGTKKLGCI